MRKNLIPAIRLTIVCLIFFSGVYTFIVWGIAQFAPGQGKGLTMTENGKKYHVNVAQSFTSDTYFWSRPSAVDYNAAGSGGSNYGPTNPDHLKEIDERINHFLEHNLQVNKSEIPSDLVTTSGSGLDPHISVQAAKIQVKRIAKIRGIDESAIQKLIREHTDAPLMGLFGTERINVLQLNLSLDKLK